MEARCEPDVQIGNSGYNEGRSPAKPFSANGETLLSRLSHYRGPPHFF